MEESSWSKEEIEYLKENYQLKPCEEIADFLGKSKTAVYVKANKLGIKKDTKCYGDKEIAYVRENFEEPNVVLAEKLSVSVKTIQRIRRENDIPLATKRVKYKLPSLQKWDEETVAFIEENSHLSNEFFSKQLGLSPKTIRRIRDMFDIPKSRNTQMPNTELEVEVMLKVLGIKHYEKQFKVGNYRVDFVVGNKAIEVQGDYWHGNPEIDEYRNNPNERQQKAKEVDFKKKTLLENHGYEVLWIWESEIEDGRAFKKLKSFLQNLCLHKPI